MGVSKDSLKRHQDFVAEYGLRFPLIADDGTLKTLYSQRRTTYIIDRQGIVRFIQQGVPVNLVLLQELDKLIGSLK